tara:strand:+ start:1252 stop:1737 length:486 start_codon:yes stop_codon:yes gene_type:complete
MNNVNLNYLNVLGEISLDSLHINQAFDYYCHRYQHSRFAQQFVQLNCRISDDLRGSQKIGLCDRTMGKSIPNCRDTQGAAIRGSLIRCGLIRSTGHELFRGCIVFPLFDENGNVLSATGYRTGRIRRGDKAIVYWGKPAPNLFVDRGIAYAKGVINAQTHH